MLRPSSTQTEPEMRFRFWGQYAHLIVPGNRAELIPNAIRQGTAPTARLMTAAGVSTADLAEALGVGEPVVRALLDDPRPAPVVVIDAEDGLPAGRSADEFLDDVVEALASEESGYVAGPLIAYRMPSVAEGGVDNLRDILSRLPGNDVAKIDGVVIPKVEAADDVRAVAGVVAEAERTGGLPPGQLRVMVQIESAAGLAGLQTIARLPEARLGSLIFGAADFAADLGLPSIELDQPIIRHARYEIVEAAAIAHVPAIDGMTLAFPVLDPTLPHATNRLRWLDRMALAYSDARSAFAAGMSGKWVGHPAQLFAVTLARAATLPGELLEGAVAQLTGYRDGLRQDRGVTVVDGQMADRATARHAHEVLRRATAFGLFDPRRALELGIVSERELAE